MKNFRQDLFDVYERHLVTDGAANEEVLKRRMPFFDDLIQKHFPRDKNVTILDLGCGYGALLYRLKHFGYTSASGVDASPQMAKEAARLGLNVSEGQILDTLLRTGDGTIDVVCMKDVLEHFTKEEGVTLAREVHRVLRKGGRWIVHVPNGEAPFFGHVFYGDLTHETVFTRGSLTQLSTLVGFSSIKCFEDKPLVHGPTSAMRRVLWEGIRGALRLYLAAETGSGPAHVILSQNLLAVIHK